MTNATENTATETVAAVKEDGRKNNGRKALVDQNPAKLAALIAIRDNDAANIPSAFILKQMVTAGLVEMAPAPLAEGATRGRGRPALVPSITGRAKSWIALMERNAAKAKAKAEAKAAAEAESEAEAPATETAETE